jgi:hypothetical protein
MKDTATSQENQANVERFVADMSKTGATNLLRVLKSSSASRYSGISGRLMRTLERELSSTDTTAVEVRIKNAERELAEAKKLLARRF